MFVEDIPATSLIDTGSMISTVAEWFYNQNLTHIALNSIDNLLNINVAGGYTLPYLGYVEVDLRPQLHSDNETDHYKCLMLVVPDTDYNKRVPILIGTNFIRLCYHDWQNSEKDIDVSPQWKLAFQCLVGQDGTDSDSLLCSQIDIDEDPVIVFSVDKQIVPANSRVIIPGVVSSPVASGLMVAEGCDTALPGGLLLAPCLVSCTAGSRSVAIEVQNLSNWQVTIPSNDSLCCLHPVKYICAASQTVTSSEFDPESFLEMFDLSDAKEHLAPGDVNKLNQLLLTWEKVFSKNDYDLGRTSLVKHQINLTDEKPIKQRHRKIPPSMYEEVRSHLKQMLDSGVIRESHSPYASPLVLVRKKDNTLRICIDLRLVNLRTIRDAYYMPRMEESMDSLVDSVYFSCLDLKSGFWQVEVEESHKERTAFTVGPLGLYECNTMPFGLTNGCATFQRLMERVIGDLQPSQCLIYIDDILVFSKDVSSHLDRLQSVFERLAKAGLKLKPQKSQFFKRRVRYLGHYVSQQGIEVDNDKVSALLNWPVPKTVKQLRRLLGFCSFYRRFVPGFSKVVKPLTDLLAEPPNQKKKSKASKLNAKRKNKYRPIGWVWKAEQQDAFDRIIQLLTSAPILGFADYSLPFLLHTDASIEGLGAVLYQIQGGAQRVIAYASRGLKPAERNYPAHKLEFLALKWAVTEKFREYLYGHHFEVRTDNNPLTYVLTSAKLDGAGHRWLAELTNYDFGISYRSGKRNIDADALSRLPGDHAENTEDVEEVHIEDVRAVCQAMLLQTPLIQAYCFSQEVLTSLDSAPTSGPSVDLAAKQASERGIAKVIDLVRRKKAPTPADFRSANTETRKLLKERKSLRVVDGILYRVRQLEKKEIFQVVLPFSCRQEVLKALHDDMGHLGRKRTLDLLRDRFFWPGMAKAVDDKVRTCDRCLRRKGGAIPDRAPLVNITSSEPMQVVCIDYLSLEPSQGYSSILVITDHFSKYSQAIPTRNQTAKTTARVLMENFILHYGVPARLHSDKGRSFENLVIKELCILLGMEKSATTSYHPQSNGQCERWNKTLLNMLGTLQEDRKKSWKDHVAQLVHAYNCTRHETTGYSPFELLFGRTPRLPIDVQYGLHLSEQNVPSYDQYVENLRKSLNAAFKLAEKQTKHAQSRQKHYYDAKARGATLQPGDLVLVRNTGTHIFDKLADKWEQPVYKVLKKPYRELPVYQVKALDGGRKRTLHRNLLLPIQTRTQDSLESSLAEISEEENIVEQNADIDEGEVVLVVEKPPATDAASKSPSLVDESTDSASAIEPTGSELNQGTSIDSQGASHAPGVDITVPTSNEQLSESEESESETEQTVTQQAEEPHNVLEPEDSLAVADEHTVTTTSLPKQSNSSSPAAKNSLADASAGPSLRKSSRAKQQPKWFHAGVSQAVVTDSPPEWVQKGEYMVHLLQSCPDMLNRPEVFSSILSFMKQ